MPRESACRRKRFLIAIAGAMVVLLATEEAVRADGFDLEKDRRRRGGCGRCVADFAIYDPEYEDDGVWEDGVRALEAALAAQGWSFRHVDAAAIRGGELGAGRKRRFRALISPGGFAYYRDATLEGAGSERIRAFVASGGGYVGLCAGAWAAVGRVRWDSWGLGHYESYRYHLDLVPGEAWGPLSWVPWLSGANAEMVSVALDRSAGALAAAGAPSRTRLLYGGGPWFEPSDLPAGTEVWGRAVAPPESAGWPGDGKATLVRFPYGQGEVVLSAFHPEILLLSAADGVELGWPYSEAAIAESAGEDDLATLRRDGYIVLRAMLMTAARLPPTPLPELPLD